VKIIKAVAYARYSSETQRQESITAQLRAIYNYAKTKGIEIVKVYTDEARTATTDEREGFQKMIAELELIRPNLVLVHKLDRFARDRIDAAFYRWQMKKHNVRLVAVEQDFGDAPEAVIMESVVEGMAQYYSLNLSREVKKGQTETVMKKQHCGGIPPLGYDLDENRQYVINEYEATAVRLIFKRKLEGKSYGEIAAELNSMGYKTKKGRDFGKNSLYDILRNEKYIGTYVFRKTSPNNSRIPADPSQTIRINNALPAIIDEDIFYKVQDLLDKRRVQSRKRHLDYWLTGLLRCGLCGQAMVGNSIPKKKKEGTVYYGYYSCNLAKRTKECSHRKRYPKIALEQKVLDLIEEKTKEIKNIDKTAKNIMKRLEFLAKEKDLQRAELEKQLKQVNREIENMTAAIAKGVDASLLSGRINEAGRRKAYLERQIRQTPKFLEGIDINYIKDYLKKIKSLKIDRSDPEQCKYVIQSTVSEITLLEDSIEIKFKTPFPDIEEE